MKQKTYDTKRYTKERGDSRFSPRRHELWDSYTMQWVLYSSVMNDNSNMVPERHFSHVTSDHSVINDHSPSISHDHSYGGSSYDSGSSYSSSYDSGSSSCDSGSSGGCDSGGGF